MMKIYTLCAVALMCCLASCSSIQTLTFDQLCPATVNFPERVRNVAVVNNMPATPEAKRTLLTLGEMNGNGKKSAEMLASSLADSKYFNQVMICDSALNDTHFAGRRILTQKEVQQFAGELDADLIFSLDQVGIQTERDELVYPGIAASWPVIKAKVTPVLSIYLALSPSHFSPVPAVPPSLCMYGSPMAVPSASSKTPKEVSHTLLHGRTEP